MGDGDIKLAFILGLLLGWLGWPQFIIGSFAAFFIGGAMLLGAWLGIFAGVPIATLYLQLTGLA